MRKHVEVHVNHESWLRYLWLCTKQWAISRYSFVIAHHNQAKASLLCMYSACIIWYGMVCMCRCRLLRCHKFPRCSIMKTMLYNYNAYIYISHTVFPTFVSIFVDENVPALMEALFFPLSVFLRMTLPVCVCLSVHTNLCSQKHTHYYTRSWIVGNVWVSSARLALQFCNRSSRKISA